MPRGEDIGFDSWVFKKNCRMRSIAHFKRDLCCHKEILVVAYFLQDEY